MNLHEQVLGQGKIPKDIAFLSEYFSDRKANSVFVFKPTKECGCKYLCEYIEKLNLDDSVLFKFKVCYEIENLKVTYRTKGDENEIQCTTMSQLIKLIDINIEQDVIIDNNNRTDLSNIVQQLIYLSVPLNHVRVMTRREISDADKIRRFNENIDVLSSVVDESCQKIKNIPLDSEFSKTRDDFVDSFRIIKENIKIVKEKALKVAVAASKKTGKSVIVNSMLEQEIAPTSLELATPNNCIYTPSKDGKYYLDGKPFRTKKAIHKSIGDKFKSVQLDASKHFTLNDMNIQYVAKNISKDKLSEYTIYDTPGPDLAGATGHASAAKKAMQEVDVVVFALDYSKYLTNDETNYLKEVKEIFERNNKFYSLIFTVNKIDQCYTSKDGNKSIIRILDYIRSKIIKLDDKFKDCIIMGTSSLTYFNCIEAMEIPGCSEIISQASEMKCITSNTFEQCMDTIDENNNINSAELSDYITVLKFLSDQVGNMRLFHKIKNISIDDIKDFSGMNNLLNYVYYVSENKARDEKINSCMSKIDIEYTKIKNAINIDELEKSILENTEKIDEIREILTEFSDDVKNIFTLENTMKVAEMLSDNIWECTAYASNINKYLNTHPNSVETSSSEFNHWFKEEQKNKIDDDFNQSTITTEIINNRFRTALEWKIDKTFEEKNKSKAENGDVKNNQGYVISQLCLKNCFNDSLNNIAPLICELLQSILDNNNKTSNESLKAYKTAIESVLTYIINFELKRLVDDCTEMLRKENVILNLAIPSFNVSFHDTPTSKVQLTINVSDINDRFNKNLMHSDLERICPNIFVEFFQNIFGTQKYVLKYNFEEIYNEECKKDLELYILRSNFQQQYMPTVSELKNNIDSYLTGIENEKCNYMSNVFSTISTIKATFNEDSIKLQEDVKYAEAKKQFFNGVRESTAEYFQVWEKILSGTTASNLKSEVYI